MGPAGSESPAEAKNLRKGTVKMLKKRSFAFNPWSDNKHFLPMIQVGYASQKKLVEMIL